jgi:hypothetical protein
LTRFLASVFLIVAALPAGAQNVEVRCPAMPILKQNLGLWEAQRTIAVAVVTLPGETLTFHDFTIEATLVRGIRHRTVDACESTGKSEDGSVMTLQLPREPVKLVRGVPTALAMTAPGTLTRPDGKVYAVVVVYPDCRTSRLGRGQRLAAAIVATGIVTLPAPSIEEDRKVLTASKWQNGKPEAAWNKLSDEHKKQLGGKSWKKVELEIKKFDELPDPRGPSHSAQLSFLKPDDAKFSFGTTSVEIREEKGKRLLVITNLDKVEYQIEYEFKEGKLQMRGSYLRREPSSGAIFIPEVFDGEYVAIPLGKK